MWMKSSCLLWSMLSYANDYPDKYRCCTIPCHLVTVGMQKQLLLWFKYRLSKSHSHNSPRIEKNICTHYKGIISLFIFMIKWSSWTKEAAPILGAAVSFVRFNITVIHQLLQTNFLSGTFLAWAESLCLLFLQLWWQKWYCYIKLLY